MELNSLGSFFEDKSDRKSAVTVPPTVHEQSDGTILAMAITGTGSKDSLASWIKFLEKKNKKLTSLPIVFLLRTPAGGIDTEAEPQRIEA